MFTSYFDFEATGVAIVQLLVICYFLFMKDSNYNIIGDCGR